MQIWQDGCDRRAEIASFTPSPINRAVAGSDFPRTRLPECSYSPSSFAFCRTSFSSRERKLAGFRHRPAVGDFVRHVTDVHCGPGSPEFCVLPRWPCMWHKRPERTLSVPTENPHGPHSAPDRNVFSSVQGTG
jgi:hypothetical protein